MFDYSEELKINLGGENFVDVKTLTNVLQGTLQSVQASTDKLNDDYTASKLVIKKVTEGSFIVECILFISSQAPTILETTTSVLSFFKTALEVRKHLKGEEPKKVYINNNQGDVTIINVNNVSMVLDKEVFNEVATNQEIIKGVTKIHEEISSDPDRSYIEFEFKNNNTNEQSLISIDKEEVSDMLFEPDLSSFSTEIQKNTMRVTIRITRLDFQRNIKWQFILNGKTESAYVEDTDFLEDVHKNRYMFGANTYLDATIQSIYKVDETGYPITHERPIFKITKVHNVINGASEQERIKL